MIDPYETTVTHLGMQVPIASQFRMRVKGTQLQGQAMIKPLTAKFAEELALSMNDEWIVLHEFETKDEATEWRIANPHLVGVV